MKQRTVPQIERILQYSIRRLSRGNASVYVNFWFNIAWSCIERRTKLEQKGKYNA